jgi:hypothetical protein
MMVLLQWFKAVLEQWYTLVTGGSVILLLGLYSNLRGVVVSPRIYQLLIFCAVLPAMFLAWRFQDSKRIEAETTLTTLRQSAQYGLRISQYILLSDNPDIIQFLYGLNNDLPNNSLRYRFDSEVVMIDGRTLEGSVLTPEWHGLGPKVGQDWRGRIFQGASLTKPRMAGIIEYRMLYGLPGDSATYRMKRKISLVVTTAPNAKPTIQSWTVLSESDDLVP